MTAKQVSGDPKEKRGRSVDPYPFSDQQLPVQLGRYQLTHVLGVGGMGTVYLASDALLQRRVALKIPNCSIDTATRRRLCEEARLAAKVSHNSVCSIYDIGCEDGHPYITMEFVQGRSLDHFVSPAKPMSAVTAAQVVIKIAAGLRAAHEQGVIHRDLKPANILMRHSRDPVITDFGLAFRSDSDDNHSCAGRIMGSPGYMSPEQVRGETSHVGPSTDVYGLGTILYELLTGRRPFNGPVPEIYTQVLTRQPAKPSHVVPSLDPRLDAVCLRALSKSPADRFQDVDSFIAALTECVRKPAVKTATLSDDAPLTLAQPAGKTAAQSMYSLESRAIHQHTEKYEPSWIRSRVEHARRLQWALSKQQTGFVCGLLAACVLCVVTGLGAVVGMQTLGVTARVQEGHWGTLETTSKEVQLTSPLRIASPRAAGKKSPRATNPDELATRLVGIMFNRSARTERLQSPVQQ